MTCLKVIADRWLFLFVYGLATCSLAQNTQGTQGGAQVTIL